MTDTTAQGHRVDLAWKGLTAPTLTRECVTGAALMTIARFNVTLAQETDAQRAGSTQPVKQYKRQTLTAPLS